MTVKKIDCIWKNDNKILVNPDGQVWPCCYLANITFEKEVRGVNQDQEVIREYMDNKDDFNIFKKSVVDILQHEWYQKTLPESWENGKALRQCINHCGIKEE